jgi:hypothetical protein
LPEMTPFLWVAVLCFRGFPIFVKFLLENSLLCAVLSGFGVWGYFIVYMLTVISTMAYCRIWFCVLYGEPKDNWFFYRKCSFWDYTIGFILVLLLFVLLYFVMSY